MTAGANPCFLSNFLSSFSAAALIAPSLDQDIENFAFAVDGPPHIHSLTANRDHQSSGAGEFHPHALSEPDVILSHHPAPIVRPCP